MIDQTFVDFVVVGKPITEGNIAFSRQGRGYHREGDRLKSWRADVGLAARGAYKGKPWEGPVEVSLYFYYRPPRKADSGKWKLTSPDIDKLARAVLDACTGVLWKDDKQIVHLEAYKQFGTWDSEQHPVAEETYLSVHAMRLQP